MFFSDFQKNCQTFASFHWMNIRHSNLFKYCLARTNPSLYCSVYIMGFEWPPLNNIPSLLVFFKVSGRIFQRNDLKLDKNFYFQTKNMLCTKTCRMYKFWKFFYIIKGISVNVVIFFTFLKFWNTTRVCSIPVFNIG